MTDVIHKETGIHYTVTGSGTPALLLIHGSNINLTYWDEQVAYFGKHHQVIAVDLPGHGKSSKDKTEWTVKGLGDDITDLMKSLDLKDIILIGHSIGADVALVAATNYPEPIIGFVGIDNFKNAGQPLPPEYQQQAETILQQLHSHFADTNEAYVHKVLVTPQTPEPVTKRVVQDYREAYPPMAIPLVDKVFNQVFEIEKQLLPKLPCKLHLINVDYMPTNEEALKQLATAGYQIHSIQGTSHFPMIENPDAFNRLLEEVIGEIKAGNDL